MNINDVTSEAQSRGFESLSLRQTKEAQCLQHVPKYRTKPAPERFWAKVKKTDGCWYWTSAVQPRGYGWFHCGKRSFTAQRIAWFLTNGPIPDGLHVLHRCDNRLCVNPAHLFLGTNKDNVDDKVRKGRHRGWTRKLNQPQIP